MIFFTWMKKKPNFVSMNAHTVSCLMTSVLFYDLIVHIVSLVFFFLENIYFNLFQRTAYNRYVTNYHFQNNLQIVSILHLWHKTSINWWLCHFMIYSAVWQIKRRKSWLFHKYLWTHLGFYFHIFRWWSLCQSSIHGEIKFHK